MDRLYMALGVAVVLFIVVAGYRYFSFSQKSVPLLTESFAPSSSNYKFVMFGVEWCPHCVKAEPIFANLGSTQTIGGKTVQIEKINPEKDENPYKDLVKIAGFPTIVLINPDGTVTEYEGQRSEPGFQDFLTAQLT
jgi:thiol-disulfide isomerase/thioredoxin